MNQGLLFCDIKSIHSERVDEMRVYNRATSHIIYGMWKNILKYKVQMQKQKQGEVRWTQL